MAEGSAEESSSFEEEERGGVKRSVARFLENPYIEICVLLLVVVDVILVSVEAGIDSNILCVGGREVPYGSPAGKHILHGNGHGHDHSFLGVDLLEGDPASSSFSSPQQALSSLVALQLSSRSGGALGTTDLASGSTTAARQIFGAGLRPASKQEVHLHGENLTPLHAEHIKTDEHPKSREGGEGHGHSHGQVGDHEATDVLVCEGRESHRVEHLVHTCHLCSIAILVVFCVELLLKLWLVPGFLYNGWHVLDIVVVFSSLLVDTVVMWYIASMEDSASHREEADVVAILLMLSRTWRVVRIIHGLYEFEEKREELKEQETAHGSAHERD